MGPGDKAPLSKKKEAKIKASADQIIKEKKKDKHFQQDYYIQLKKIENRLAHIEEQLSQKK